MAERLRPSVSVTLLGRFEVAVDAVAVPAARWTRRHATALVKLLALAPGHRLHREQVVDALWPDDALAEAVPKLHKAAHFARRALDVPNAVALRGASVLLCPDAEAAVDVDRFEALTRTALATGDAAAARDALAAYGGELLPTDRYEPWLQDRREQLRLRHLELLRLDEAWEALIELDPSDELAHLALMRRHVADGDRHAALRQFERLTRALHRELGVRPGREAVALRDRVLTGLSAPPARRPALLGRDRELAAVDRALRAVRAGGHRTLLVSGAAGMGKSALVAAAAARAAELGLRTGSGTAAAIEGARPFAPVVEALADLCRRHPQLLADLPECHRRELERVLAGGEVAWTGDGEHQRLVHAAAELVRPAAAGGGVVLTVDDLHEADDATLRLLHYLARSTPGGVGLVLAARPTPASATLATLRRNLLERHAAVELPLGPLDAGSVAEFVRRHVPDPSAETLDQVAALGRGIPFVVTELARRAAAGTPLDDGVLSGVPEATREVLARVAVAGTEFDTDEFLALADLPEDAAYEHLDAALAALVVEPTDVGYRFRHAFLREALLSGLTAHRRRRIHRDAAERLVTLGAPAARIGHHLLAAGAGERAVPYLLRAAETDAAIGAYRDALALVDDVRPHATGADRARLLGLRADLLTALGDPGAAAAYREALDGAAPDETRRIRVRLAHAAVLAGDADTAASALDGLELDGGPEDADILLVRGKAAFFRLDLDAAQAAAEAAQRIVLAGARDWKVLDLVTLQAMVAHVAGGWSDRLRRELTRTRESPAVANTVFEGSLCAVEYLLYGPTPYPEVIAVARDLQATARRSGAQRAEAFAAALVGEAALLSGDLPLAATELARARATHRELGSSGGEAHALQRLAEVHLVRGERETAARLVAEALPLARESPLARHLLHRVFGTMIGAAAGPAEARAVVERADLLLGVDDRCVFCSIMFLVPAAIACARVGDVEDAEGLLDAARRSAQLWEGTSWMAAIGEVEGAIADARGDEPAAHAHLVRAAESFERAGQPLDARRCRDAAGKVQGRIGS